MNLNIKRRTLDRLRLPPQVSRTGLYTGTTVGWTIKANPNLPELLMSWGYMRIDNNVAELTKPGLSRPWPGRVPGSVYWEQQGRPNIGLAKPELYKDRDDNYWATPWLLMSDIYAEAVLKAPAF